jgi:hypothetical protein
MIVRRCSARKNGVLDFAAEATWQLLRDWSGPGTSKWIPKEAFRIERVESQDEHTATPTRVIWNIGGKCFSEKLLLCDDRARRLYYTLSPNAIPGVCNYVATTAVDELGPGKCEMLFASNFDLIDSEATVEQMQLVIQSVYETILTAFDECLGKSA